MILFGRSRGLVLWSLPQSGSSTHHCESVGRKRAAPVSPGPWRPVRRSSFRQGCQKSANHARLGNIGGLLPIGGSDIRCGSAEAASGR